MPKESRWGTKYAPLFARSANKQSDPALAKLTRFDWRDHPGSLTRSTFQVMNSECLNNWRQEGSAHLWRYKNSSRHRYSGLNIRADAGAITSLVDLAKCLAENVSATRTIHLAEPEQEAVSIPGFDSDFEWFRKLTLDYEREHRGIVFAIVGNSLILTIGHAGALTLRGALERYDKGDRDFAMPCEVLGGGKYDRAVWFW